MSKGLERDPGSKAQESLATLSKRKSRSFINRIGKGTNMDNMDISNEFIRIIADQGKRTTDTDDEANLDISESFIRLIASQRQKPAERDCD